MLWGPSVCIYLMGWPIICLVCSNYILFIHRNTWKKCPIAHLQTDRCVGVGVLKQTWKEKRNPATLSSLNVQFLFRATFRPLGPSSGIKKQGGTQPVYKTKLREVRSNQDHIPICYHGVRGVAQIGMELVLFHSKKRKNIIILQGLTTYSYNNTIE